MAAPNRPTLSYWLTFGSHDLERSRAFYSALGFETGDMPGGAGYTFKPDGRTMVCVFPSAAFAPMVAGEVVDSSRSQEVVQSVQVESREAIDALVEKALAAGGRAVGEVKAQPYGFAGGFTDPDGHVWAVLAFTPPGQ